MSRRFPQPEGPSADELAFAAPLFTPIFSLLGLCFTSSSLFERDGIALFSPLIAIVSVAFGYIGLIFVCVPVMALLAWARRLNAVRLCFYTTLIGAGLWAAFSVSGSAERTELDDLLSALFVGGLCSLGVTATFCALGKIPLFGRQGL